MRSAGDYTEAVAAAAAQHEDFVMGFISVSPSSWKSKVSPGLIQMTPGVQLTVTRPPFPFLTPRLGCGQFSVTCCSMPMSYVRPCGLPQKSQLAFRFLDCTVDRCKLQRLDRGDLFRPRSLWLTDLE